MRLYAGSSTHFITDTTHNQIAAKLETAFFQHYRYNPSPNEVRSWQNSLRATASVFQAAGLDDHGVLLEYQLPLTSRRLDCIVTGHDAKKGANAVIIELKQWDVAENAAVVGDKVVTWVGGGHRDVLHPSVQVGQYRQYLEDNHEVFYEEGDSRIGLSACAYLHNYHVQQDDVILSEPFLPVLKTDPLFSADDVPELCGFLSSRLEAGDGLDLLTRIEESRYRPSKKLMEHVASVIAGKPEYVLLDEQLVAFERVMDSIRRGHADRRKTAVIIRGGPGTGKSVIAINLMASLLREDYVAQYATGSKAFTETLRRKIGSRGGSQFKYFNSYMEAEENTIDVLIADEAHRIREVSHNRFTPKAKRTDEPQIEELIRAAKVGVYFIDDRQGVRPEEIGSADLIKEHAEANDCRVFEYQLEAQFRCAGSAGFVNWIDNTLGIARTANVIWDGTEDFDFRILPSPMAVEEAIREKADEGHSARMVAGFSWKWSSPNADGTLVDDVVIGDYERPWNAKPGKRVAEGIPPAPLWATDPGGIDQIGCIYTAQGFEFDYTGVIIGPDIRYDLDLQQWVGFPKDSYDTMVKRGKDQFVELVKNTYRVLLSRGMKGCYAYFVDKDTERFVRSRMEVGG